EGHINGATAQADILGIFGRENLDMAARWTTPDPSTPTYKAIKIYRNYDGNKSTFGDTSVSATVPNPDNLSSFAAVRTSDNALTIMVISKVLSGNTPTTINISNFNGSGTAAAWQLTSANQISQLPNINYSGSSFTTSVPPQSITLFVIPAAAAGNIAPTAGATASPTSGTVPLAVAFNGSGSSDPDGTISSYAWDFGDGTSGTGATTSHTYTTTGTFSAKLTVTDNGGASSSTTLSIVVNPDPTALNAPSNLSGSNQRGSVTLKWTDNSNNETGFYIERAPSGTQNFARVGAVGTNVTTYSESISRGTYIYRVNAYNTSTGKVSAYSNTVQVRVK